MIRAITIALTLLFAGSLCAQGIYGRKKPEIFPTDGKMRRGGFYFAPGITYALPRGKDMKSNTSTRRTVPTPRSSTPKGRSGCTSKPVGSFPQRDPVILDYWDFRLGLQAA
jgi:hypothetical protein